MLEFTLSEEEALGDNKVLHCNGAPRGFEYVVLKGRAHGNEKTGKQERDSLFLDSYKTK